MYHILIVGAGYVGSEIAKYYAQKKQKVWAVTRNQARAEAFESAGIIPVIADLTRPETLKDLPPAHFIVISPAPDERNEEAYRKVYLEGIGHFLDSRADKPQPSMMVYLSSTGVWDADLQGVVDEAILPEPKSERSKILLAAERQVLMSKSPATVFRLSGIYGPERNWIERLRQRQWPEKNLGQVVNMIHRDDIVSGVSALFSKAVPGEVYLGVDDEPVTRYEMTRWLAQQLDLELPLQFNDSPGTAQGKQCCNKKMKALGWQAKYSNYRQGYQALLAK